MDSILDVNVELTLVTIDLLERTGNIKLSIMNSMLCGDSLIVRGVELFERVLIENNPEFIDDVVVNKLNKDIEHLIINNEQFYYMGSNYIRYGIMQCLIMLEIYNGIKNKFGKKKVRTIDD